MRAHPWPVEDHPREADGISDPPAPLGGILYLTVSIKLPDLTPSTHPTSHRGVVESYLWYEAFLYKTH